MERLKEFGYKNVWSTWIHCNMSPTMVAKLIVCTAAQLSAIFNLKNRFGPYATATVKTMVYLKPHDSVQRPRVSRYGLMAFLFIFWNPSGVLHHRLLETS